MTPPHRLLALAAAACAALAAAACATPPSAKGPAFHLQLVSSSSSQPIAGALIEIDGPDGTVSARTTCKGVVALRLPQGTWPARMAPTSTCRAARRFLVPIADESDAYELFALDDHAGVCPGSGAPEAAEPDDEPCRQPGRRQVLTWRPRLLPASYLFDHPHVDTSIPRLPGYAMRKLPLRDLRDL